MQGSGDGGELRGEPHVRLEEALDGDRAEPVDLVASPYSSEAKKIGAKDV